MRRPDEFLLGSAVSYRLGAIRSKAACLIVISGLMAFHRFALEIAQNDFSAQAQSDAVESISCESGRASERCKVSPFSCTVRSAHAGH